VFVEEAVILTDKEWLTALIVALDGVEWTPTTSDQASGNDEK
jgi:hypothetical protein